MSPSGGSVDSHEVAEQYRILSHGLYAEAIRRNPALLTEAKAKIDRQVDAGGTTGHRLWQVLLTLGEDEILGRMVEDSEVGRRLRSNSPFSTLIGVTDPAIRHDLWQEAKTKAALRGRG